MAIYYNTPAKTKETMTEVGNRKKKQIFFHKNVTPDTLQRSFFLKLKKKKVSPVVLTPMPSFE